MSGTQHYRNSCHHLTPRFETSKLITSAGCPFSLPKPGALKEIILTSQKAF